MEFKIRYDNGANTLTERTDALTMGRPKKTEITKQSELTYKYCIESVVDQNHESSIIGPIIGYMVPPHL